MMNRITAVAALGLACLAAAPAASLAAPLTYQTAVLAPLPSPQPFAFYRFGETGIVDGATAADTSLNARNGEYNGAPAGGAAGSGLLSDTAVAFSGTGTGAAAPYMAAAPLQSFGNNVGASSYEFVFKTNAGFSTTTMQSLFGVFSPNAVGQYLDVEATLNSRGNDALGALANTTRFYIKGQDGDGAGVHFTNAALYDGNFHHLVFTFDESGTGAGAFAAYVDGVPQTLTFTSVASSAVDANTDPDTFGKNFDFIPTFAGRNVRGTAIDGNGLQRLANVTLDEAVLYASVLSPAQVLTNYATLGIPEPTAFAVLSFAAAAGLVRRRRA